MNCIKANLKKNQLEEEILGFILYNRALWNTVIEVKSFISSGFWLKIQLYFWKFWKISKASLFRKKLYFESFRLGFNNWKANPSILGNFSYWIKVSFSRNQA